MKECKSCLTIKPLDEYHRRTKSKDGRQSICKLCNREQRKAYYQTAHGREKNSITGKRWRVHVRQRVWDYLKEHPCVDCGESDLVVLDFDHRDETQKLFNIAMGVRRGYGWAKISAEISKCDVRCANCHRRKTAIQFGWLKGR